MNDTLLATKLHIPPLRTDFVPRQRLTAKLNRVLEHKLTLITAPAGFGKTTLIREWVKGRGYPVAWLSLDEQDNSPPRFLSYLIHAFRQVDPQIGNISLALLNSSHLPHTTTVLTHLTNDLAATRDSRIIVLDDYHVINDQTLHDALDFLIAHLPAHVHLIVASRSQPALALALLRGRAQLLELDSADLRFTSVEVETFLKQVMHLDLTPPDWIALETRTEGWIAGLQLAALSLQAREDKSAFIASFTGSDRYIGDYLFEEVLQHQPNDIRHFLLCTSVVDTLCGGLCDALLDASDSQSMLERLDMLQLFIVPLDHQREWYRYHHLFVELLRQHLNQTFAEQVPRLQRRASKWFEQHGRPEEAIRHRLKAGDFDQAAALIEAAFERSDWIHRDMRRLLEWFDALPEAASRTRPKLELAYAWLLLEIFSDQWERIELHLINVEHVLTVPNANASWSEREIARMLAQVDLLRANRARHAGEPSRVIDLCQQALDRLPDAEVYLRSGIVAHLATAYEDLGDAQQARTLYSESMRMCRVANNIDGLLFAAGRLIEVLSISGQLRQAEKVFAQAHAYVDRRTGPDMGMVYAGIGDVYREQNRLEQAKTYLTQGIDLCRPFEAWRAAMISAEIGLARVWMLEGRTDEALDVLTDIDRQDAAASLSEQTHVKSIRARLLLARGEFDAAARWARQSGLAATDDANDAREFDQLSFARVLIAQAALEAQGIQPLHVEHDALNGAQHLLERLHSAAFAAGRMGRVIEIRLLQALAHDLREETDQALHHLQEALTLAEPEGYVRVFADEGLPLYRLLTIYLTQPLASIPMDYVRVLLAAFPESIRQSMAANILTERELNTLRLLATELTIAEIASEMFLSVSSVRTYAKRIYSKLDVHSRAQAVYRAKELKLLQ